MSLRQPLTVEEGIKIQDEHLALWKKVLTPEAFDTLCKEAKVDNICAHTGYDICRGTYLDEIVHNIARA